MLILGFPVAKMRNTTYPETEDSHSGKASGAVSGTFDRSQVGRFNLPPAQSATASLRGLISMNWSMSGFSFAWACLVLICLLGLFPSCSLQASTLGERDFSVLSSGQISNLVSSLDPVRNIDPSNPNSHLSKILIPRVGEVLICFEGIFAS
jgi:hypothetical protein